MPHPDCGSSPNQVCFKLPLKTGKADRRTQYIVLLEFAGIPFLLKSDSFPTNDQAVVAVDQCESRYGASIFIETTDVGLNNNNNEASKYVVIDLSIKLSENISYLSSVPLTQVIAHIRVNISSQHCLNSSMYA